MYRSGRPFCAMADDHRRHARAHARDRGGSGRTKRRPGGAVGPVQREALVSGALHDRAGAPRCAAQQVEGGQVPWSDARSAVRPHAALRLGVVDPRWLTERRFTGCDGQRAACSDFCPSARILFARISLLPPQCNSDPRDARGQTAEACQADYSAAYACRTTDQAICGTDT